MKRHIFTLLLFVLVSCGTSKHTVPLSPSIRDSIRIETKVETIFVKDTINVLLPSQDKENTTTESFSHLETDFAESDASIDSTGTLHHTLSNKNKEVPVPSQTPIVYRDSIVFRDREIEVPVPYPVEKEVPRDLTWWQQTQMICFWIMLSLLALKHRRAILEFVRRFI